jgi:CheY-like chemotaxis protein
MKRKSILVVSNQLSGANSLGEWSAVAHPYHVRIVSNDELAIELCHQHQFDIVVVDGTDELIDSRKLHAVLPILQDDVTMLRYEGEDIHQLSENIKAVFDAKKYKRIQQMLMLEPNVGAFSNLPSFSLN